MTSSPMMSIIHILKPRYEIQLMKKFDLEKIHFLLIDLDDTLYPYNNGLWNHYKNRIEAYLIEVMHFPPKEVPKMRHHLYTRYGTTLRGLQQEYDVDMDHYVDFVHDVPLKGYLHEDKTLVNMFKNLPQRKIIFTNAHAGHAHNVLETMGLSSVFQQIIDIYQIQPYCKPQPEAFQKALQLIDANPEDCLMVDDSPQNLATAHNLGMATVSIGPRRHKESLHIPKISHLSAILQANEEV